MSNLVLDSLEIKNFRAFKHLKIEKLGRVNLIVGKNNVGKSSVLEGLWLYASGADPAVLSRILFERSETSSRGVASAAGRSPGIEALRTILEVEERAISLNNLFNGRIDTRRKHEAINIRSLSRREDAVSVDVIWPSFATDNGVDNPKNGVSGRSPEVSVTFGLNQHINFPLDQEYRWDWLALVQGDSTLKHIFVGPNGLEATEIGRLWDNIALSDSEIDVLNALQIIAPEVRAVSLVGRGKASSERIAKARLDNLPIPIALRSMGEGMNRMFGIALALVNAKDGMLLIDEVDTGLHYSVLPDLWKLIFEVAHRLNVQVFATSHSWDCIQAFQQAAADNTEEEGVLVRLENRKGGVGAVTFDEPQLAIVTREQIEVR